MSGKDEPAPKAVDAEEEESAGDMRPWQLRLSHFFMLVVMMRLPFFHERAIPPLAPALSGARESRVGAPGRRCSCVAQRDRVDPSGTRSRKPAPAPGSHAPSPMLLPGSSMGQCTMGHYTIGQCPMHNAQCTVGYCTMHQARTWHPEMAATAPLPPLTWLLRRAPCAKGVCSTPVEVVAVELYAYDRCPHFLIKLLLYPGAFSDGAQNAILGAAEGFPTWQNLLDPYENITVKRAFEQPLPRSWDAFQEQQMDLVGGSFIVAMGALSSAFGPSAGPTLGMALLMLYCWREEARMHTYMWFAVLCSLAWIPVHKLWEKAPRKKKRGAAQPAQRVGKLRTKGKFKVM